MEFVHFDTVNAADWDALLAGSPDGWCFCLTGWLTRMRTVWDLEEHSFAALENGQLVGLMPLQYRPMGAIMASGGWGHGGPCVSGEVTGKKRRRVQAALLEHAVTVSRKRGARLIQSQISPIIESSLTNPWGVNPLAEHGWEDTSTHAQVVDLRLDVDTQWSDLSSTARNLIRRCRDAGYTVRAVKWAEHLDRYYELHCQTYRRTGTTPHPRAYFEAISPALGDEFSVLWAGFDSTGEPVAYHHDARFGAGAMYQMGCSCTDRMDSGINYLLFWEALRGEKNAGYSWYESGEIFPEAQDGKTKGLSDFKRKFGGETHRYFRGKMSTEKVDTESMPTGWDTWRKVTRALGHSFLRRFGL